MSRAKVIASLALLAATTVDCMIPDLPSEEGVCPCAPGYRCDEDRNVCVSKGGADGAGGGSSSGGHGGATGSGGDGVGACGGANAWNENNGVDWSSPTLCDPLPSPGCGLLAPGFLCCDNTPVEAHVFPSESSPNVGVLIYEHSWFACWLTGEEQPGGNDVWFYTSVDMPVDPSNTWGFVAAGNLHPNGSAFDPANPAASGLPRCPCP